MNSHLRPVGRPPDGTLTFAREKLAPFSTQPVQGMGAK